LWIAFRSPAFVASAYAALYNSSEILRSDLRRGFQPGDPPGL